MGHAAQPQLNIMTKQPESRLQLKIRKALELEFPGSFWRKIHSSEFQSAGIPDLVGCVEGYFFALEVKMPDNKPTPLQRAVMQKIRDAGGYAGAVYSPEQAVGDVRFVLKALGLSKTRR